jgi:Domain of unknown function (DUF4173)
VLLAADALLKRGIRRSGRPVRLLSAGLVALVFVVIASALQRMYLYQEAYGLTQLRIHVIGVTLWLAILFAWFALTVLSGRRHFSPSGRWRPASQPQLPSTSPTRTRSSCERISTDHASMWPT